MVVKLFAQFILLIGSHVLYGFFLVVGEELINGVFNQLFLRAFITRSTVFQEFLADLLLGL
jgi:hypothetical protein